MNDLQTYSCQRNKREEDLKEHEYFLLTREQFLIFHYWQLTKNPKKSFFTSSNYKFLQKNKARQD